MSELNMAPQQELAQHSRIPNHKKKKKTKRPRHLEEEKMASVTKPTITYFPIAGRAEVSRLILEDAGVDYDFVAVPYPQWAELKAKLSAAGTAAPSPLWPHENIKRAVRVVSCRVCGRQVAFRSAAAV
jgi:hypothetical protein